MARHARPLAVLGLMVVAYSLPRIIVGTVQFDGVDVHFSAQRYFSDALRSGQLPFWTPYIFAGFPFLADLQVGAWYPLNWPFFIAGISPASLGGELLVHTLIACCGAYALMMRRGSQPPAAVATGMFYGLSGYFAAHSQHVGIFDTAAWLPWLLLVLEALVERLTVRRMALAALVGAALALPGHFQTALYAFSGAAVWAALNATWSRSLGQARGYALGLATVGVWGALLAAVMILPALELTAESVRRQLDPESIEIGFFHPSSLLTLVLPDYYGLLSGKYIGPGDSTQHYFYAGVLLVPMVLVGLANRWALKTALFLGLPFLWYAVGPSGGLFRLVARLPGFSSVELPMHGWFLPALGLALLGGAGFESVASFLARAQRSRVTSLLIGVLFVDVFVVNQLLDPLAYARQSFDQLYGAPQRLFEMQLQAAQPPVERLYGAPLSSVGYRNHALQQHVQTTYGYNPLELAAYADYAAAAEDNPRLVDGLAATHRLIEQDGSASIQSNPSALPLVFFARQIASVPDFQAAQAALRELDPTRQTLVVGTPPAVQVDPSASVEVVARADDRLTVHYRTGSANLLRVAIPWYPGWHAASGGVELPTLRVDDALLGVVAPPGEADIELWYAPRFFWPAAVISVIATAAVLLGLWQPFSGRRRRDARRAAGQASRPAD
jgi:hypothetical protein